MIRPRRTDILLLLGMLGGAALTALGIVRESSVAAVALPGDTVAVVNGQPVSRASFDTAVALVERDRGSALTADEKGRILDRLVDEELLVQHGLELGLVRSDRKLRGDLVAGVIEAAAAQGGSAEPSAENLAAFFESNRAMFTLPPALRVAQVFVAIGPRSDAEAAARAWAAARRLRAGEDVASVRRDLGDPPAVEVPGAFQPASRLQETLGPSASVVAMGMKPGEVSDPLRIEDGYRVLVVVERGVAATPSFEARREDVLAEYRRRRGEGALREALHAWRRHGDVKLAPVEEDGAP